MKRGFKITRNYIETHFGHDNVKTITLRTPEKEERELLTYEKTQH